MVKFDPFLSLDCARVEGGGAIQGKEGIKLCHLATLLSFNVPSGHRPDPGVPLLRGGLHHPRHATLLRPDPGNRRRLGGKALGIHRALAGREEVRPCEFNYTTDRLVND